MSCFFKSCSSKSAGDHSLEDGECVVKGKKMVEWKMPKVPTSRVFEERKKKKKLFNISSDPSIRATEVKLSFGRGGYFKLYEDIYSNYYDSNGRYCNIMNVGLVQIGVKTLTRKVPANASIIVCLRDNRVAEVKDCFLGLVESKLGDGPFYFNAFPNTTLSLNSSVLLITNVLSVHVFVNGFDELPKGSEPILVTCRTCYKLNPDNFGAEALLESPVGKTLFFQTQIVDDKEDDVVQKVTIWDEVQLPSDWPPQLEVNRPSLPRTTFGRAIVTYT